MRFPFVVLMVAGVLGCLWLGALRTWWGLDTLGDVARHLLARTVPARRDAPATVLRAISRRLPGVQVWTANGRAGAAAVVRVFLAPQTLAALLAAYGEQALSADLEEAYLRHATARRWRLPVAGVRVTLEQDLRLQRGWVELAGLPGAYRAESAATASASPQNGTATQELFGTELDRDTSRTVPEDAWRLLPVTPGPAVPPLTPGRPLVVGRTAGDLMLDGAGVSRRHARFRVTASGLHVEDLDSTNGTWLDGRRLDGRAEVPVPRGAVVSFGRTGPAYRAVPLNAADRTEVC